MNARRRVGLGIGLGAAGLTVVVALAGALGSSFPGIVPPGEDPAGDGLDGVLATLLACRAGADADACTGVVYVWSELMPLSREGIPEITSATGRLGVSLALLDAAELEARAAALFPGASGAVPAAAVPAEPSPEDALVRELLAAGATVHQPSLVVVREGRLQGGAILGFKTADAYQALVRERLAAPAAPAERAERADRAPRLGGATAPERAAVWTRDYTVQGRPGAYFRSVPGRQTLAYEANARVHLLDLARGSTVIAPGYIDFVPTPDGRMFVTPGQGRGGLDFYDADEVFRAAAAGAGRSLRPVHTDREMRDQYPSVGILSSVTEGESTRVVYRVLTSWFDRIVYRDYEALVGGGTAARVRPLGEPIVACPTVSIPILSPDGKELAGRDEGTATTRIFALEDGCRPVDDLRVQSGKVAWAPDGKMLAFAIPRGAVRDGTGTLWVGGNDPEAAGIFLYRRGGGGLERVAGSENAHRIAFPEFVGSDSLAFQLSPTGARDEAVFRLICCTR